MPKKATNISNTSKPEYTSELKKDIEEIKEILKRMDGYLKILADDVLETRKRNNPTGEELFGK
jgi:phage gp29-like protein